MRDRHKSSHSGNEDHCVEVAEGPTTGIRDIRDRDMSRPDVPAFEWTAPPYAVRSR